jgi:hypothetical protein
MQPVLKKAKFYAILFEKTLALPLSLTNSAM